MALQRRHEEVADETDDDLALLVEAIETHAWLSPLGAASAAIAATVVDSDALAMPSRPWPITPNWWP